MAARGRACAHVPAAGAAPQGGSCPECASTHSLRVCSTCGYVSCCESQYGHDRDHWRETGHPVIRPYPLSDRGWTWCYRCDTYV